MLMELAIEIKAKPGRVHELAQTLEALLATIRNKKGCRGCRFYRNVEDDDCFFLLAHWESQEYLGQYLRSSNGMALVGAIDMLSEEAAVKTYPDARWEGVETLKRIRKHLTPPSGYGKGKTR
jgi:quinol monooxygenase YgiN